MNDVKSNVMLLTSDLPMPHLGVVAMDMMAQATARI